jgi:hypothetical protein
MVLTLDTIGERYGMLPSEVLSRGSTLDIYVMDVALSYHEYQRKKSEKKVDSDMFEPDQLKAMMDRVKKNKAGAQ